MAGGLGLADRRATGALVLVEIVCLLLLLLGNRLPVAALTGVTTALLAPANGILRWVEGVATAKHEATRLRSEIASLRMEQGRLVNSHVENRRLRALLGFAERGRPVLKPVQVVGVAGEPWPIAFHLGAGTGAGLAVGQAVLSPEGLVGRLTRVDAATSTAALLSDPNTPVACEVVGSGVRGVLKFRFGANPGLYLTAVPLTDTVRVGDRIATAATSVLYPAGIPVGRVVQVGREESGLLSEILIDPLAPISRLREVLVATGTADSSWWPPIVNSAAPAADSAAGR
ncbi:MAG: rod shape-determining protein MreC [Candidatus Eisenbacteria bacterium]